MLQTLLGTEKVTKECQLIFTLKRQRKTKLGAAPTSSPTPGVTQNMCLESTMGELVVGSKKWEQEQKAEGLRDVTDKPKR